MVVGCYTLDVYCEYENDKDKHTYMDTREDISRTTFIGPNRASCIRQAKKAGWSVGKVRAYCPKHNRFKK